MNTYLQEIRWHTINDHVNGIGGVGIFLLNQQIKNSDDNPDYGDSILGSIGYGISGAFMGISAVAEGLTRDFFSDFEKHTSEGRLLYSLPITLLSNIPASLCELIYQITALVVNILRTIPDIIIALIQTKSILRASQIGSERLCNILTNINQIARNCIRMIPGIGYPLAGLFDRIEFGFLLLPGIRTIATKIDSFIHCRSSLPKKGRREAPASKYIRKMLSNHADRRLFVETKKPCKREAEFEEKKDPRTFAFGLEAQMQFG